MAVPTHVINRMGVHRQVQYLLNAMFGPGDGVNTRCLLFGAGTSADPVTTDIPDKTFIEYWVETTATSGDTRWGYFSLKMSGAGASGDTLRVINTINAANIVNADAIHATQTFSTTATHLASGQAQAIRATLGAGAATRSLTGHLAALLLESDIATGNTVATNTSFLRIVNTGNVTIPNLLELPDASNGTIFAAHTTETMTHSAKCISYGGTAYYLMFTNAATHRS